MSIIFLKKSMLVPHGCCSSGRLICADAQHEGVSVQAGIMGKLEDTIGCSRHTAKHRLSAQRALARCSGNLQERKPKAARHCCKSAPTLHHMRRDPCVPTCLKGEREQRRVGDAGHMVVLDVCRVDDVLEVLEQLALHLPLPQARICIPSQRHMNCGAS